MTQNAEAPSKEQVQKNINRWNQEEIIKVQKFCSAKNIQLKGVKEDKCQVIPPHIGIWYITTSVKGEDYWVVSGDYPTDLAPKNVAKNARQVLRHFSMSWQLKAANLEAELAAGNIPQSNIQTQEKIVQELTEKAESLYKLMVNEKLWEPTGFKLS